MPGRLRHMTFVLTVLTVAASAQAQTPPGLSVVVTVKPAHALVAGVLADVAVPTLLVDGAASPHSYAMRPSDAQKINHADVLFRISEALEPFTAKIAVSLPAKAKLVTLADVAGVKLLPRREGGAFEPHAAAHDGHGHKPAAKADARAYDPHIWLDPDNAKAMVAAIAATMTGLVPQQAARIKANAETVAAEIDAVARDVAVQLAPVADRPFVVFHDAYQYFERRFGLTAAGSITVSPDVQPSARRLADLRRKVQALSVDCIFSEPNVQDKVIRSVAEGTRLRVSVLDPEATALPPGPQLYGALMRGMAAKMTACLAGTT